MVMDKIEDNNQDQELIAEFIRVQCGIEELLYSERPEDIAERLKLQRREAELLQPIESDDHLSVNAPFPEGSVAGLWQKKLLELFGDAVILGTTEHLGIDKFRTFPLFSGGIPVGLVKKWTPEVENIPLHAILLRFDEFGSSDDELDYLRRYVTNRSSLIIEARISHWEDANLQHVTGFIAEHLRELTELKIYGTGPDLNFITRALITQSFDSGPHRLEKFELTGGSTGHSPLQTIEIIQQANLPGLKYLKLHGLNLEGGHLPDIAAAECLRKVVVLDLSNNQLGYQHGNIERMGQNAVPEYNEGLARFVGVLPTYPLSPNLAALRFLVLRENELGGDSRGSWAASILAGINSPAQIQELGGSHDSSFAESVLTVRPAQLLQPLKGLELANNNFSEGDIVRLKKTFAGITYIDFSRNGEFGYKEDSRILGLIQREPS